jgi:hypothetical protein
MLAYILAVLVGIGSIGLFIAAFFFPEIHRKHDFIWIGVGCFYALALWIYARQEIGGILVGQTASVALIGWFTWQTLMLRRQLVVVDRQTPIPSTTKIQNRSTQQSARNTAKPASDRPSGAETPTTADKSNTTVTSSPSTSHRDRSPATAKTASGANPTQQPSNSTPSRSIVTVTSSPSPNPTPSKNPADPPPAIAKTPSTQQSSHSTPTAAQPAVTAPSAPNTSPADSLPAIGKTAPLESNVAPDAKQISKPTNSDLPVKDNTATPTGSDPATPIEKQAWIEIKVRPASEISQPLGNPAQPPTTPANADSPKTSAPPEIVTEPISSKNVPSDAIPTTAKLESENWE